MPSGIVFNTSPVASAAGPRLPTGSLYSLRRVSDDDVDVYSGGSGWTVHRLLD